MNTSIFNASEELIGFLLAPTIMNLERFMRLKPEVNDDFCNRYVHHVHVFKVLV